MSTTPRKKDSARFAELDGLRALAVIAVILFHCEVTGLLNAGFFGVDVFFTISGFLITALLLEEYRGAGDFQFLDFYFRRLKRLLPPVLALMAIALPVTAMLSDDALHKFVADMPAAFLYVSNWWQIYVKQNYFDTTPHVLKHLWSLAIEEQFYIVLPPVLYAVLKRSGPRAAGMLALAGSIAGTLWMAYLYGVNADASDQNRIYLGTDTHAMGLLLGAALACFWNPRLPRNHARVHQIMWRSLAVVALVLLGLMVTTMNTSSTWLYRGAFLAVPALTCALAYATMGDRDFVVSRLLRHPVMQWFGLRSYSLYLIHWLVFECRRMSGPADFSEWQVWLPMLTLVGIGAELMYRCVELRCKRYELKMPGIGPKRAVLGGYAIIAVAFSAAITLTGVKPQDEVASKAAEPAVAIAAAPSPTAAAVQAPAPLTGTTAAHAEEPIGANIRIDGGDHMVALGDSVLLGAKDVLTKTIPGIQVDAAVGRQASQGLKVVRAWHDELSPSLTVLVHLGTNGYIDEGQFRELLTALAVCKSVILINVHAERRWTAPNNEMIARMHKEFPNTHLVDWSGVSAGRPEFFVKDGIHLTRRGIDAFTAQIKLASGGAPLPDRALAGRKGGHGAHADVVANGKAAESKPVVVAAVNTAASAAAAIVPMPAPVVAPVTSAAAPAPAVASASPAPDASAAPPTSPQAAAPGPTQNHARETAESTHALPSMPLSDTQTAQHATPGH